MGIEQRITSVENLRAFTDSQRIAVFERGVDLLVTAGAGSGKTRTLVARYLAILAEGYSPRQVVAITFTEKAAREMRNRVRNDLVTLGSQAEQGDDDQDYWQSLLDQIETARIGTIHSLCAEIIRSFPAEAGLDPEFEVLEEGLSAMFKNEAVQMALARATQFQELTTIFEFVEIKDLTLLLTSLLEKCLEINFENKKPPDLIYRTALKTILNNPILANEFESLEDFVESGTLIDDAGEIMGNRIDRFVKKWQRIIENLQEGSPIEITQSLFDLRKDGMNLVGGKRTSQAKNAFRNIREFYDDYLNPWIGGANQQNSGPSQEIEDNYLVYLSLIEDLFNYARKYYQQLLFQQRFLDFDDLEYHAHKLLGNPDICAKLQDEIDFLLVDEFQDTNQRQRDIILSLAGDRKGCLFMVGDAQQSIYRFRGADVEVFVDMKAYIKERGGENLVLETTFRSHKQLLDSLDVLLKPVLGEEEDPDRPFAVPYQQMQPAKIEYAGKYYSPSIEFLLGFGDNAVMGRAVTAAALADRLIEMRARNEINSWDEVALLFRASSGYVYYEDAFANAGIPYVTVAGRGFYDRPEIRDLLNVIRCVANPWDDTAIAGFLRSPVIGFTDAELLILFENKQESLPLYATLRNFEMILPEEGQDKALFALRVLQEFSPLVNRLSVSELMEKMVVFLNYRAILAEGGNRMLNNLDKLLADARQSNFIQLSEYLDYMRSAKDIGVRTGEAVSAAQDSVQLMTIHKSKGLEFPLVILADASNAGTTRSSPMYLLDLEGTFPSMRMSRMERQPLLYEYARMLDQIRENAEDMRLLYVACTRAQEKLIFSGHSTEKRISNGYLKLLGCGVESKSWSPEIDLEPAMMNFGEPHFVNVGESIELNLTIHNSDTIEKQKWDQQIINREKISSGKDLYSPIRIPELKFSVDEEEDENRLEHRNWRATRGYYAPAVVVGKLVHKAIQRWFFPGDDNFNSLISSGLIQEGVVDPDQQLLVLNETKMFLERFKVHELFKKIEGAEIRKHEVPYSVQFPGGYVDTGIIDLLYLDSEGWRILDFKTDKVDDNDELVKTIDKYETQLKRYQRACTQLLGQKVSASVVLMDVKGSILIQEIC